MSKKSPRIISLLNQFAQNQKPTGLANFDPHYLGYFECFNRQMYYEAHEVLEELWLQTKGHKHLFYKGLIQLAGAFVHLKNSRLGPATRLFRLALKNLEPYGPLIENLDISVLTDQIRGWLKRLENPGGANNPYHPEHPPQLVLQSSPIGN